MSASHLYQEYKYKNKPIIISQKGYDIMDIYFKISDIDKDGVYRLLKKVQITIGHEIIFQTNGMIIKSMIENFSSKHKIIGDSYPISLEKQIYSQTECKLHIDLDENMYLTNNITVFIKYTNSKNLPKYLITSYYQSQSIPVTGGWSVYKQNIKFDGVIKYFLFYVEPHLQIESVDILICNISQSYNYDQLNMTLPYIYLGYQLPKNYLFIPHYHKENNKGYLNLSRIDQIEAVFKFKQNHGGKIYLISESINILSSHPTNPYYHFHMNSHFDNYEWDNTIKYSKSKKGICQKPEQIFVTI